MTLFVNWAVKPFSMALHGDGVRLVQTNTGRAAFHPEPGCPQRCDHGGGLCADRRPSARLSAITVPWDTLLLSVVLYIMIPVIGAQIMRGRLLASGGQATLDRLLIKLGPASLVALLATLVLLFGFQGEQIIAQPAVIARLAVPILIQVYFNSGLAYLLNRLTGEQHCVAGPSALIGASNFFELAVAAAISLFGFHSGAALATVVGVLIEVPVMLSVVWIVNRSRGWYKRDGKAIVATETPR